MIDSILALLSVDLTVVTGVFADLETEIKDMSVNTVMYGAAALVVLCVLAVLTKERAPRLKAPLFISIATIMIGVTLSLVGSTVYLNVKSDSGGPVHWHADIEMWACGQELELIDPTGLSNKVGTSTLHEHNDRRIHLEGVVVDRRYDASIGKFMNVVGGGITDDSLVIPLNPVGTPIAEDDFDGDQIDTSYTASIEEKITTDGEARTASFVSGDMCGDEEAEVQVFVYRPSEDNPDEYSQYKLDEPGVLEYFDVNAIEEFSINEDPNVPPGDCIIFEFDVPKDQTDKLCEQYGVRDIERCEEFGVEPNQRSICKMQLVPNPINASSINESEKVVCNIEYNVEGEVVGISAPSGYISVGQFDPKASCSNYEGNLD